MDALKKLLNNFMLLFQNTLFNVIVLCALTLSITVIAYNRVRSDIPATYPEMKPLIQGTFAFSAEHVTIRVSAAPTSGRMLVFAYDEEGNQWSILKPVYRNEIIVTRDERPDFKVVVSAKGDIRSHKFLKEKEDSEKNTTFYQLLAQARNHGYRYGVQECLYPMEQRCADICPVKERDLFSFHMLEDGRIAPKIDVWGCPRTGICIQFCPQGIIRNVAERIIQEGMVRDPQGTSNDARVD